MSHEKDSQYYSVDGDIFSVTTKSIELKATPLKGVLRNSMTVILHKSFCLLR